MITKPTVFVLGAGASMPYGFPSGDLLRQQICAATASIAFEDDKTALIDKGQIHDFLVYKFGEKETEEFGNAFYRSHKLSIDAFLERQPKFIPIGKAAITLFILRKELETNLSDFETRSKGFYENLLNKLDSGWENFLDNKIGFVTFNYDRSLEQFFFNSLKYTFGKSDSECAEKLIKIPFIHIHGVLGPLPWQSEDGIPYGATMEKYTKESKDTIKLINRATEQIKVIHENQPTSPEFTDAFELLSAAERIYFLGFGYDQTNLKRLSIDKLAEIERQKTGAQLSLSRMKGTGLGLELKEIETVQMWFINIPDATITSLLFLKRYADLD